MEKEEEKIWDIKYLGVNLNAFINEYLDENERGNDERRADILKEIIKQSTSSMFATKCLSSGYERMLVVNDCLSAVQEGISNFSLHDLYHQ